MGTLGLELLLEGVDADVSHDVSVMGAVAHGRPATQVYDIGDLLPLLLLQVITIEHSVAAAPSVDEHRRLALAPVVLTVGRVGLGHGNHPLLLLHPYPPLSLSAPVPSPQNYAKLPCKSWFH